MYGNISVEVHRYWGQKQQRIQRLFAIVQSKISSARGMLKTQLPSDAGKTTSQALQKMLTLIGSTNTPG